jgi:hypothetical protein
MPAGAQVRKVSDLQALFVDDGYESHQVPSGTQARLLVRLYRLYEEAGLLPHGRPAPLVACCRNATECWAAALKARPAQVGDNGCVALPWVGRGYRPGGVVVLGINPNIGVDEETDLLIEHGISWDKHHVSLENGERRQERSAFAFGAMRSAAVLLDVLDDLPVRDRDPVELVETLHRTVRLQSIKCVPRRTRSKPTPAMWRNCPPMLLGSELDIVKPASLLVLGTDARWAIQRLDGYRAGRVTSKVLSRGVLERRGWSAEIVCVAHPASSASDASYATLLRSFRRRHRR